MKRVVVTGGAGFIGSHVVDALQSRGNETIVVDNFESGKRANLQRGTDVVEMDVADPAVIDNICRLRPDTIVHAAAQVSVPRSMADPQRDRSVNLLGTANVIDAARRAGNCRIVFLSTGGGIYGETTKPATELALPKPKSYYSIHKYTAERYLELSGLSYAVARLANVYGSRRQSHLEGGVVAIFADRLVKGRSVTIHGTGEQRRDLVHVKDVVDAILLLLDVNSQGLWNVGTGQAISINSLLSMMEEAIQPAVSIEHDAERVGDVFSSCLSVKKIRDDLNWEPRVTLKEGIRSFGFPSETLRPTSPPDSGDMG